MNQSHFPIIFHQIMGTRQSSRKFLTRALRLITEEGDVETHDYPLTPVVVFLYPPLLPKLDFGLCASVSLRFLPTLSPRSIFPPGQRFPIPNHVTSGFPVTSGSGDVISGPFRLSPRSPMTRGVPMTTPRPIRSQKLSTNQKPALPAIWAHITTNGSSNDCYY